MLIDEALAQAPNAQAVVDQTSAFYLNQGVLGATVVLLVLLLIVAGLVIRHLYNDLKALNEKTLADRERLIVALDGVADSEERHREAMQALKGAFEARGQALGDISSQMALTAQETRHGFANLKQSSEGLVEILRDLRSAVRERVGGAP